MQNFYNLLHVSPTAGEAEIKEALRDKLRLWTNRTNAPQIDRRQEAERMIKVLEEAESILLNPGKRAEYGKQLANNPRPEASRDKTVLDAAEDLVAEGRRLLAGGNIGDALYAATKATERDGGNSEAWALLGRARFLFGDVEDAICEYKRAIKLKPNEGRYYDELGDIYEDTGKLDDAFIQYSRAAQVEPGVAWYRAKVGLVLLKQDKIKEAIPILESCHKEQADVMAFRSWLTVAYINSARDCCSVDPASGNHYPTSKTQIIAALDFLHKAESVNADDANLKSDIARNKQVLRESIQRKYVGSTGAAVVGGILWLFVYFLGVVVLPLYFYASRPPQYAIYKRLIANNGTITQMPGWLGLFLPVIAIVNYFTNYTGENDTTDIKPYVVTDN